MEMRTFGRTGLQVSILGFGCGAVGGLMVRGAPADQERAVARALETGVNYFDTAAMYGNGEFGKEPRPRADEAEAERGGRHQGAHSVSLLRSHRRGDCGVAGGEPDAHGTRAGRYLPFAQRHHDEWRR